MACHSVGLFERMSFLGFDSLRCDFDFVTIPLLSSMILIVVFGGAAASASMIPHSSDLVEDCIPGGR